MQDENKKKNELVKVVEYKLIEQFETYADSLPKDFNRQRFLLNCMKVVNDPKKNLKNFTPNNIVANLMKGALLGLDFFNNECYLIPYGGELRFQLDYRGEMKLKKKYSRKKIATIYAKLIREGDEFEEKVVDGRQVINFNPLKLNDNEEIGVFAVVQYEDGSTLCESMSKKEVERIRDASQNKKGTTWKEHWGEMAKKTAIKRVCKLIDIDFDNIEQSMAFDSSLNEEYLIQKEKYKAKDVYAEQKEAEVVIEAAYKESEGEVNDFNE